MKQHSFDEQVTFLVQEIEKAEDSHYRHKKDAEEYKRSAELLRGNLKAMLEESGVKSMEAHRYIITVKPAPYSVIIPDNDAVPEQFCRLKKEPNKSEIKKFIESNKVNWASLSEPSTTIQLKVKENG